MEALKRLKSFAFFLPFRAVPSPPPIWVFYKGHGEPAPTSAPSTG